MSCTYMLKSWPILSYQLADPLYLLIMTSSEPKEAELVNFEDLVIQFEDDS